MKRIYAAITDILVYGWIPFVSVLAFSVVMAQSTAGVEEPGVHMSVGAIAVVVGIVAVIGPGFYLLGRYDHRLSTAEEALAHIVVRMETIVERGISTGDRIAVAVEGLAERGVTIECPGPK